jgi:hypothetical protein
MVEGKLSIGRFGGALRRILFAAEKLTPELVEAAQSLTEQITQKVLSVKAGSPAMRFADFDRKLRELLHRRASKTKPTSDTSAAFEELFLSPSIQKIWKQLYAAMPDQPLPCLQFLRNSHELKDLLPEPGAELRMPANDLRLRSWLE